MTFDPCIDSDREAHLNEALLAYVEARQAGAEPNRKQFLEAHPDLCSELEEFFAGQDELTRLAGALNEDELKGECCRFAEATASGNVGVLGDFRLVREIGKGGMGVVYEAEQVSLHRRV